MTRKKKRKRAARRRPLPPLPPLPAGPPFVSPGFLDGAATRPLPEASPPIDPAASVPILSPTATVQLLDERGLPIVTELARVAASAGAPTAKLEGALEVLFGAYGERDPDFSGLFLAGWLRAREDKHCRLTLAWQREQLRLSLQDILAEGVAAGAFRPALDAGAVAAIIVGAAEGCLLQAATEGGAVSAAELVRAVVGLALNEA